MNGKRGRELLNGKTAMLSINKCQETITVVPISGGAYFYVDPSHLPSLDATPATLNMVVEGGCEGDGSGDSTFEIKNAIDKFSLSSNKSALKVSWRIADSGGEINMGPADKQITVRPRTATTRLCADQLCERYVYQTRPVDHVHIPGLIVLNGCSPFDTDMARSGSHVTYCNHSWNPGQPQIEQDIPPDGTQEGTQQYAGQVTDETRRGANV